VDLQTVLQQRFGFPAFRDGQLAVIRALLAGRSAAAVFPTGAGKSLCYQLPALLLDGVTLVVSPLLALMKDQVDALRARGISAARLDSTLSVEEYSEILRQARRGELKLLYVAPERFQNERFRESLAGLSVALFAVDEAHCVSEWGHNFRPDYLKLAQAARACDARRVLALTATATPRVLDDICRTFSIETRVRTPFFRPNLVLDSYLVASPGEKLERLLGLLGRGPTVVYVTLQRTAMELAQQLAERGFPARPYHAGLEPELRENTQEWFLRSPDGVVVATIAFGMGIDKPDIRIIVHYDPPKSVEGYSQEIGRAGRDGADSRCTLLYFPPDRIPLENFIYGDTPAYSALRGLLDELFEGGPELVLNLNELSNRHDIRPLVLRTLLTYLELDGYLKERTPVYSSYSFKALLSSAEILAQLKGEPREFMSGVFRQAVKKRIWLSIDLERAAVVLNATRERVVRALDYCHEQSWLEVRACDLRHRYLVQRGPASVEGLAEELYGKAQAREQAEVDRLGQVLALVTGSGCLAARLSLHFGEQLEQACGRCRECRGESAGQALPAQTRSWQLPPLPEQLSDSRSDPRLAARFLCGISSPHLTRDKLTRDPRFGSLAEVPFAQVLERLGG
jgi:ATP-dependent DNA helicase RecQ